MLCAKPCVRCCCACTLQTNGRFGELLVVLVSQYIDQLLQWCAVQDSSAIEVDWENIGADRLGPFDVRVR